MTLKAVFFDLDGTLLDTAEDLGNALNSVLIRHQKSPMPQARLRDHVSNGAAALIRLGFGLDDSAEEFASLRQQLLDAYAEDLASHTRPFTGIEALIEQLANNNIAWGIATNKPAVYAEPLMEYFSFASEPVALICPEHVKIRKPDPEALTLACDHAKCKTSEAIYIGDHLRDIQCGTNAGMPTIAVGYGYIIDNDDHRSWQATHTVDHAEEIWPIIQTYL